MRPQKRDETDAFEPIFKFGLTASRQNGYHTTKTMNPNELLTSTSEGIIRQK